MSCCNVGIRYQEHLNVLFTRPIFQSALTAKIKVKSAKIQISLDYLSVTLIM